MAENKLYTTTETQWCPGCGNFGIINSLTNVLNKMEIPPKNLVLVGGIGQAAKLNQFVTSNGFSGLHGRALPAVLGIKAANPNLTVIVNSGDGDSYGEGGNHFLHNIRRNIDATHFVHNNQIYGLTTGQPSPTTNLTDGSPNAVNPSIPLKPLLVALSAGATFVARTFSGNPENMEMVMEQAINHKGYAIVDILQPCVTFNKINTFQWYNDRVKPIDESHDVTSLDSAMELAKMWGDEIPIGIYYKVSQPDYKERRVTLAADKIPAKLEISDEEVSQLLKSFI